MFSRLGCLGVSDGRLGVRRPLSAATQLGDGARLGRRGDRLDRDDQLRRRPGGGLQRARSKSTFEWLLDRGLDPTPALRLTDTIFIALAVAGVALVYLVGVRGMATVKGAPPMRKLLPGFAHTLIPIAFAYLVAHYFSLFVFQEQAQFTYLLSDPLGTDDHRPLRHRLRRRSTSGCSAPTRSGTSRSAPWSSAT